MDVFIKRYKIFARIPEELAGELHNISGGNDHENALSQSGDSLVRSWLVPLEDVKKTISKLRSTGFSDLNYAESIIHLLAIAPKNTIAKAIHKIPSSIIGTLVTLNELISGEEILDFKGSPSDANVLRPILAKHGIKKMFAMEAFVPLEDEPNV